jgi:hypothetical protein
MPHTKKESKSIEKQIMKTNLIDYDIIDNMARNKFLPSSVFNNSNYLFRTHYSKKTKRCPSIKLIMI